MNLVKIRNFQKEHNIESNWEFIKRVLENNILSDEEIIDKYFRLKKYTWSAHSICKKWESIRKKLSDMRKKGILEIVKRVDRDVSSEIFFKLK